MPPLPIAEFAPISADFQLNVWNILLFLSTLAALWASLRRKPNLDAHLAKFEAAIATLTASVNELTDAQKQASDHSSRIRQLESDAVALRASQSQCAVAHRADQSRVTREWFERIEGVEKSMASNFQTMERALGRIEGQLTAVVAQH